MSVSKPDSCVDIEPQVQPTFDLYRLEMETGVQVRKACVPQGLGVGLGLGVGVGLGLGLDYPIYTYCILCSIP